MRFSLSSRLMRRSLKGLTALTLGATTLTFAGCIGGPSGLGNPFDFNKPSSGSNVPQSAPVPPSGLMQVSGTMPASGNVPDNGQVKETVPGSPLPPVPKGTPLGTPVKMCTLWDRDVRTAPDPLNHGQQVPCLVGRLIMFGSSQKEVCPDGTLIVTLFDERPAQGGPPKALERWVLDKANLRKLICTDTLGLWGFTLPMPTAAYRPEMTFIRMDLEFTPDKGNPIYHSDSIRMHSVENGGSKHAVVPAAEFNPGHQFPPSAPPQSQADLKAQQLLQAYGLQGPQAAQTMQAYSQGQAQRVNPQQVQQYQGQPQQLNPQQVQQYQGQLQQVNPQQYQGQFQQVSPQQYVPQQANPQQFQIQPQQVNSQQYQYQPQQGVQPMQQQPASSYGVPAGTLPVQPANAVNPQRAVVQPPQQYLGSGQ